MVIMCEELLEVETAFYSLSGEGKGIQYSRHSCYIDSFLMSIFYVTRTFDKRILVCNVKSEFASWIQNDLRKIVHKIRTPPYRCPHSFVSQLRLKFKEIVPKILYDLMDVEHFLTVLLGPSGLQLDPFIRYVTGKHFYHPIILPKSHAILPQDKFVQKLVNTSMSYMGLKLQSIDVGFIVKMPMSNGKLHGMDYIVPNLALNLSACSENGGPDYTELELLGVICFQSCHFTSYLRHINQSSDTKWLYYDSLGPTVKIVPQLEETIRSAEENPDKISLLLETNKEFQHLVAQVIFCIYALKSDVVHLDPQVLLERKQVLLKPGPGLSRNLSVIEESPDELQNLNENSSVEDSEKYYHENIASMKETLFTQSTVYGRRLQKTSNAAAFNVVATCNKEESVSMTSPDPSSEIGELERNFEESLERPELRKDTEFDGNNSGLQALLYAMLAHTNIFDKHLLTRIYWDENFDENDFDDVSVRSMLQAIADNLRKSFKTDFKVLHYQVKELRFQLECRAKTSSFGLGAAETIRLLFLVALKTRPFITAQNDFLYLLHRVKKSNYESIQTMLKNSMKRKREKFQVVPYPALIICKSSNSQKVFPNPTIVLDSDILADGRKELTLLAIVCKKPFDGSHFVYVRKECQPGIPEIWIKFDPPCSPRDSQTPVKQILSLSQDLELLRQPGSVANYNEDLKAIHEDACIYIYYPKDVGISSKACSILNCSMILNKEMSPSPSPEFRYPIQYQSYCGRLG